MVTVVKRNGRTEQFSARKLRNSAKRVGIPKHLEDQLLEFVEKRLYENITTQEIFQLILEFLATAQHQQFRLRYGLKEAIMQLGPAGYVFEKFVAQVLSRHGYQTQTNLILRGRCINHEIDIVAQKDQQKYLVECKFHHKLDSRTDVIVPLYVHSRFLDLNTNKSRFNSAWIVTNTKLTSEAYIYGQCVGLHMISWNQPRQGNLADLVEKSQLYPITILISLSIEQKKRLLHLGQIFCRDLLQAQSNIWQNLGASADLIDQVKQEIISLLSSSKVA